MFIAAFVAGLTVQIGFKETSRHSLEFSEELGQILNLSVFFLFGLFVVRDWRQFDLASVLYAALSLTVVRMLPVAIALIGAGLSRPTVVFMGWFGPRGLASIVLGTVYLEREMHLSGEPTIRVAVMMTVLLSIFAHGLSAVPGIAIYARKNASLPAAPPSIRNSSLRRSSRSKPDNQLSRGTAILRLELADLAALLMHKFGSGLAVADEEFEPSAPGLLSPNFRATDKIAPGDEAYQLAGLVNHWVTRSISRTSPLESWTSTKQRFLDVSTSLRTR